LIADRGSRIAGHRVHTMPDTQGAEARRIIPGLPIAVSAIAFDAESPADRACRPDRPGMARSPMA